MVFLAGFLILDLMAGTFLWVMSTQPDAPYWLAAGFWHHAVMACPVFLALVTAVGLSRLLRR